MSIQNFINERNISEVLHFTTNKGLTGIFDSKKIKSRAQVREDERLSYILKLNTPRVFDLEWVDYINFSLSRINHELFNISSGKWHSDVSWFILSFSTDILHDQGVLFTTTNNIYTGVKRLSGLEGLASMYEQSVCRWNGNVVARNDGMPLSWPTCMQAEVLYPKECSTDFLRKIYVQDDRGILIVDALIGFVGHREVDVIVDPSKFGR